MSRGLPFDPRQQHETTDVATILEGISDSEPLTRAFVDWGGLDWPSWIAGLGEAVGDDPAFAVAGEDQAEFAAAILATWAGAPPLVVLPSLKAPTVKAAAEVVQFRQVLGATDGPLAKPTVGPATRPATRPATGAELPKATAGRPPIVRPVHQPCIAMFTGGSTGGRRLWWKTLDNLFAEALTLARKFSITRDDVIVATVPPCHIYGLLLTCLVPMVTGARIVREIPRLPEDIVRAVVRERASVLVSVPAHYGVLADPRISDVRLALSSSAPLPERVASAFHAACGVVIHEIFGSTETGGMAVRPAWPPGAPFHPLPGVDVRFDTSESQDEPDLKPELEGQRLRVCSPFLSPELPRDDQGYFVTADRVRARIAGFDGLAGLAGLAGFDVLGRADGVVKVAGRRLDLAAIEEAFRRLPEVSDVWVWALPVEGARGTEVAALVVTTLPIATLRARLGASLDPSAIPHRLQIVEAIPRTEQGKFDRDQATRLLRTQGSLS